MKEHAMDRDDSAELLKMIHMTLEGPRDFDVKMNSLCQALRRARAHYHWVGIYWVEGEELILKAYVGPRETEHTRIPIGQGICGSAARSGKTEIVGDVNQDPRYLACFASTRSEIVVPIVKGGHILGEIDIDSDEPEAFTAADKEFLEAVAGLVAEVSSMR